MSNIEDTINEESLPVNTIAMLNRMIAILSENETNCALSLGTDNNGLLKFKKCLWLVNSQVYGQMETIDMIEEWKELTNDNIQGKVVS